MGQEVIVSVVMPAHNSARYIEKSIASVLNQSFRDLELIIVDDSSTDNTLEILERIAYNDNRVIILKNFINLGCAISRNKALLECKGRYIAFCDSDDIWEYEKLEKQIKYLKKNNFDMVFTAYEMINRDDKHIKFRNVPSEILFDDLLKENVVTFSSTLFKKEIIDGTIFKGQWFHEDYVFLLECIKKCRCFNGINEVLIKYRVHNRGRSFNKFRSAMFRWKIYRKFLGLNFVDSIYNFINYIIYGIIKYF